MARKGIWIVLEGIDGSGKSTLAKELFDAYENHGSVLTRLTSEPTGERFGKLFSQRMNQHLTGVYPFPFDEQIQVLTRDRFGHCATISHWLSDGAVVIQDRFWPSTIAYQGQSADVVSLLNMHQWLFSPGPDFMFWIDTPLEEAARRRKTERGQVFDKMNLAAHEIYDWLHKQDVLVRIDGSLGLDHQVDQIFKHCIGKGWNHE